MGEKSQKVEIEGEIGRIEVEYGSNLVPAHQPRERIYTQSQQELFLLVGANMSYHVGLGLINRLLHRSTDRAVKFRTYRDYCERSGKQIEDCLSQEARDVLAAYHFDPEDGKEKEPLAPELTTSADPYADDATLQQAVEEVNASRLTPEEQVKSAGWQMEDPEQTCYVSFDDIGVKHQKEYRAGEETKRGVYVWNTVADIETNNSSHILTGVGMQKTFLLVLAYLLANGLLAGKTLVFFTDGARNIFNNIEKMFSFHPYTIILDWYHLKKRCQEYLSMSVKGKEKRNGILHKLLRILWAGNVDEAISYLRSLSVDVLRPVNRIHDLCQYIDKHRKHIPPYALRAELGLRNSSNRVEKANDLVVAQRQKHNGMSWSTTGSGALAQITALIVNDNLHLWLKGGALLAPAPSAA